MVGSGGTLRGPKCPELCQACALWDTLTFPAWLVGHWDPLLGTDPMSTSVHLLLEASAVSQWGPL